MTEITKRKLDTLFEYAEKQNKFEKYAFQYDINTTFTQKYSKLHEIATLADKYCKLSEEKILKEYGVRLQTWKNILVPQEMQQTYSVFNATCSLHYANIQEKFSMKHRDTPQYFCATGYKTICDLQSPPSDFPCVENCAINAIDYYTERLKTAETKYDRWFALVFLVHLVGDLHQPLHVGFRDDRGGNDVIVHYLHFGSCFNLHQVWDQYLIQRYLQKSSHSLSSLSLFLRNYGVSLTYIRRFNFK